MTGCGKDRNQRRIKGSTYKTWKRQAASSEPAAPSGGQKGRKEETKKTNSKPAEIRSFWGARNETGT